MIKIIFIIIIIVIIAWAPCETSLDLLLHHNLKSPTITLRNDCRPDATRYLQGLNQQRQWGILAAPLSGNLHAPPDSRSVNELDLLAASHRQNNGTPSKRTAGNTTVAPVRQVPLKQGKFLRSHLATVIQFQDRVDCVPGRPCGQRAMAVQSSNQKWPKRLAHALCSVRVIGADTTTAATEHTCLKGTLQASHPQSGPITCNVADNRPLLAAQRVDKARLPDVWAPDDCDRQGLLFNINLLPGGTMAAHHLQTSAAGKYKHEHCRAPCC